MSTNNLTDAKELFIKMAIMAWDTHIDRMNKLLDELTDEQLAAQTATGRNTGIYLLGHLTAVHDRIIPLLGVGERLFPQLEDLFVTSPDKSGLSFPSVTELKKCWNQTNATLAHHFTRMQADDWFTRHSAVSEQDFSKEPHRNKLNILINRTNHLSYHLGQLVYLK